MAKLKVMCAGALEGPVGELAPTFGASAGHDVELSFNTVGALRERFAGREHADVIILSTAALQALEKDGRFAPGSAVELGRATCGVAVRDGMLPPNIATLDGFRRMLKLAASIAANDPAHGGSSGIYLADLLERLGLVEEVRPKLTLCKTGRECALALVRGDAEVGITFTSEFLAVPGTRVVGPLPAEIGYINAYAGAIAKEAPAEPAQALLAYLQTPAARECFARYGLD